jgi:hypothetical protein
MTQIVGTARPLRHPSDRHELLVSDDPAAAQPHRPDLVRHETVYRFGLRISSIMLM